MTEPVHVAEGVVAFKSIEVEEFVKTPVNEGSLGGVPKGGLVEMLGAEALVKIPVSIGVDVDEGVNEVEIGGSVGAAGEGITGGGGIVWGVVGSSVSFGSESIGGTGGAIIGEVEPVIVEGVVLLDAVVAKVDEDVVLGRAESPRSLGRESDGGTGSGMIEGSGIVLSEVVGEAVGLLLDEVTVEVVRDDVVLLESVAANVVATSN